MSRLNLSGREDFVYAIPSKINLVTSFFYPVSGDVEDYPFNISKILKEANKDIEVITTDVYPDGKRIYDHNLSPNGIKILRFPTILNLTWFVKLWLPKFDHPKIIHLTGGFRHPHFLITFLTRGKAKLFISPFYPLHPKKNLIQKLYVTIGDLTINKYIVKRADCCFAETNKEADWLKSLGAKKIVLLPNSLNKESFIKGNEKRFIKQFKIKNPIIFSLGRQVPIKNFEEIIEAVKDMDVTLVIGGEETDYTKNLKELVKTLKLKNKVIFYGFMNQKDKRDWFACCDIFVLSSIRESLGTVVLEAMAQEKPVIVTDTGGLSDVVPNNFCLYKQGDLEHLRIKIINLLLNKKYSKWLGSIGKEKALKDYSYEKMKKTYLEVVNGR